MNRPTIREFDRWRNTEVGIWFFDVHLKGWADAMAMENGRGVGRVEDSEDMEFMTVVRNAGVVQGVDNAITEDPFVDEREEREDEDRGSCCGRAALSAFRSL